MGVFFYGQKTYRDGIITIHLPTHLEGVPYRTLVEKFNLMLSIAVFMKYVDKYQRDGVEGIR